MTVVSCAELPSGLVLRAAMATMSLSTVRAGVSVVNSDSLTQPRTKHAF